ncbi:MAG: hypothetical protein R2764_01135 [Bacteroidales bacterium]
MFKKDSYILGSGIGIVLPIIIFGLIYFFNLMMIISGAISEYLNLQTHILISLAINLLPFRYYMVSLKYDRTGRGILLFTFIFIMLFFVFKDKLFV